MDPKREGRPTRPHFSLDTPGQADATPTQTPALAARPSLRGSWSQPARRAAASATGAPSSLPDPGGPSAGSLYGAGGTGCGRLGPGPAEARAASPSRGRRREAPEAPQAGTPSPAPAWRTMCGTWGGAGGGGGEGGADGSIERSMWARDLGSEPWAAESSWRGDLGSARPSPALGKDSHPAAPSLSSRRQCRPRGASELMPWCSRHCPCTPPASAPHPDLHPTQHLHTISS